ncbi:flavodoxin family protein [uncultured Bacteroides sp.]|uniref:flavodoxin family protein n=1 Tax=uncultured Bacteroides sp. TaxID=162156 RepID=UPI002AA807DC|nr:flavodoxin family protein [uncultured Bacteroides sp.]
MKVVAINGSPHKKGNTYHALTEIGKQLQENGIDFEIIHLGNQMIHGCIACGGCGKSRDEKCSISTDSVNEYIQQMKLADGIILASPVFYAGIPGTMKSFLDRAFYVSSNNNNLFRHKVGAAVVAVRRTGGSSTFDSMNHYLNYSEMILATSNYWNIIHGRVAGEVLQDAEGIQIMEILGRNMAWLLKMREQTAETLVGPESVDKVFTNFVR